MYKKSFMKNHKTKENKRNQLYDTLFLNQFNEIPYSPHMNYKFATQFEIYYFVYNLALNSGEVPTDIYKLMGCAPGTFRSAVSDLYRDKLIRRNFSDGLHTYLLSAHGKMMIGNSLVYILTPNTLSARKRHIRLARVNTFFEGLYISTFLNRNPEAKNIVNNPKAQRNLYFYNSYQLKKKVDLYSEKIRRAKAFGVLVGKHESFMVYYEPQPKDFYFEEALFRERVSNYIGADIKKMLMVVDNLREVAVWLTCLYHSSEYFTGDNPSDLFENVYFLAMDGNASENLEMLYRDHEVAEYVCDNAHQLSKFNYERLTCDFEGEECYFVLTLRQLNIIYLMARCENRPNEHFRIITTKNLLPLIKALFKDKNVNLHTVDVNMIKRNLSA